MDKRTILFILVISFAFLFIQYIFVPNAQKKEQVATPQKEVVLEKNSVTKKDLSNESFFVIENENQQLVFSNLGGAIAEVNLPLQSPIHPKSPIHPVETDRLLLLENSPLENFPLHEAVDAQGKLFSASKGGYYPLLRRPIQKDQIFSPEVYLGQIKEYASTPFKVTIYEKDKIQFQYSDGSQQIIKTYAFSKEAPYFIDLWIKTNFSPTPSRNFSLNSGMCEVELTSGGFEPQIKISEKVKAKTKISNLKLPKNFKIDERANASYEWSASTNGFFGILIDPMSEEKRAVFTEVLPGTAYPSRISQVGLKDNLYPQDKYPGYQFQMVLTQVPSKEEHIRIYAGPNQRKLLVHADQMFSTPSNPKNYSDLHTSQGFFSFISVPFAKFLLLLMNLFYFVTHSYGFSIILLTIALRFMLYPLNTWSIKSNIRLQAIAPKLKLLQERYKKEPKVLQMETMKLYKGEKVNPVSGCFPILIQIPFLIGFFDLLRTSFELRGVSFIPGWINDLSAPDVLFSWNYSILFFGFQFHFLPILLGFITFLQQKMTMKLPKDKTLITDQQKQQKMMANIMPILFIFLFYKMPSGLNLYFLTSTILGIVQQYFVENKLKQRESKQ